MRIRLCIPTLAVIALCWGGTANAALDGGFPRIGAYPTDSPANYDTQAFRDAALRYQVLILTQFPAWQSGRSLTMAQVAQDIKSRSRAGTRIFIYVSNEEVASTLTPGAAYYPVWQKLNAESWWLYPRRSVGMPVPSPSAGNSFVNNTTFGLTDLAGKNWGRWKADFDLNFVVTGNPTNAPNASLDGFFSEGVSWRPRVDGDWNLDNVTDLQTDPIVQGWIRAGAQSNLTYLRSIWAGSLQIGNLNNWGNPAADLGVLDQALQGGAMKAVIGQSYSVETTSGFVAMMAWYRKTIDACAPPKLVVFGHENWVSGNFQEMRYGLASTLMDDGYYYVVNGTAYDPNNLLWFDEFDANLGYPTQTRQVAAWSQGVWRRDFDNGIVLVNPRGNLPQTVSLGGSFRRLSGLQDPATNNGAVVTTVTLADRDGLLLLRVNVTTDAGSTDAGSTDAGSTDAGSTDAGSSDGGSGDAGTVDGGTPDPGVADAGLVEKNYAIGCSCQSTSSVDGFWALLLAALTLRLTWRFPHRGSARRSD